MRNESLQKQSKWKHQLILIHNNSRYSFYYSFILWIHNQKTQNIILNIIGTSPNICPYLNTSAQLIHFVFISIWLMIIWISQLNYVLLILPPPWETIIFVLVVISSEAFIALLIQETSPVMSYVITVYLDYHPPLRTIYIQQQYILQHNHQHKQ